MNIRYFFQLKKGLKKSLFYASNFGRYFLPNVLCRWRLKHLLSSISAAERQIVEKRVAYYNRLPREGASCDTAGWLSISELKYPFGQKEKFSTYFFDLYCHARYFATRYKIAYRFGDVTCEPEEPAFVKSRPVKDGHSNAVLLKLNRIRHFVFPKDGKAFRDKKDMLVSRNIVRQPHRRLLLELYSKHPLCNIGQINRDANSEHPEWIKEYLTIPQQLEYKFVCCIEGNDVATNLKWVMASNSLAIMPRPKYETWFMEGELIPNYHYVEIKEDYSDLIEKMEYYIQHSQEAERIIEQAHHYVARFLNKKRERIISLRVMQTYFERTGQTTPNP